MKQQEYLFRLVKSLTKSEKRHFKLFSSFQHGDKSYLSLFDTMDRQKVYNETSLQTEATSKNNLSVAKSYLNNQILRSLRNFHASISVQSKVYSHLKDIEILYQKRLVPQGQKTLKKARSLCIKHELFGLLLVLLDWERRLNQLSDSQTRSEEAIYKEQLEILAQQNQIIELQSLYNQLIEFKQQYGYVRGESRPILEKIIDHPLLQSPDNLLSVRAGYYYWIIASGYYYMVGKFEQGYNASLNLVQLDLSPQEDYEYLNGTLEHVSSCMFFNRYGEALHYLQQVQTIIDTYAIGKYEQMRIKVFYFRSNYELMIYVAAADRDAIRKKLVEIEAGLTEFKGRLKREMEFVIASAVTYAYFVLGDYKTAKSWVLAVLNESKRHVREDIYNGARIQLLFTLAQLDQLDVLSYELNSAQRYFQNKHKKFGSFDLELLAVEQLRKFTNLPNRSEVPEFAKEFRQKLEDKVGDDLVHNSEDYEMMRFWAMSKEQQCSFYEVKAKLATPIEPFTPAKKKK